MASRSTRKTWETAFLLSASMSSSYTETFDRAQQILKDLGAENIQLGDEAERAAQRQENAFNLAVAAIAETGLLELLGYVKEEYKEIIDTAMEFEHTVSAVKAISGAGATEIGELEEKARTLGETTVFTARQSAEAMTYIAQAGWDTEEMLEGMSGLIDLAAASGTDLSEAANITADTLAGFGMEASETTRLANVLAQTAARTNTNVTLMGDAFSYSAAIAGALGFEIEDVAVMMGLMANAGVKGSKAGTSMRNIMNGLAQDVKLTSEAFGEVEISMFDENGESKGLVQFVKELREYFDQMTKSEKIANAQSIATKRGYNGLLAILNATDDQFEELYADIENSYGAADRMARVRLDNLQGDVTLLKSAWESLTITYGEEFLPIGRDVTQVLTNIVQSTNDLVEANPELITGINLIVGALGGALTSITAVTAAIKVIEGLKLVANLLNGKLLLTAGIGALVGVLAALAVRIASVRDSMSHLYDDEVELAKLHQDMAAGYKETAKAWQETIDSITDERDNTLYLVERLEELEGVQDKTLAQKREILSIVQLLNEEIPDLALSYNEEADALNMTADAIRNRVRAEAYAEEIAEKEQRLKELYKQENSRNKEFSEARDLYNRTKETYERVLEEEAERILSTDRNVYTKEDALYYAKNNVRVKAAREAMEEAGLGMTQLRAAQTDSAWWINALSEEIAEYYAGQEEIKEAEQAAGTNVEDAEDMMDDFIRYGSVQSTDAESEAEGQQEIMDAEVPDGAVMAAAENPVVIESTININGNVTEETLPEVEQIVNEAAEKVIERLERTSRSRVRAAYN